MILSDNTISQATCAVIIDGKIKGTAWLISLEGHLLTAGHLLGEEEEGLLEQVHVRFQEEADLVAHKIQWIYAPAAGIDFAVLKLKKGDLPLQNKPLRINLERNVTGDFLVYGYGQTGGQISSGKGDFLGHYDLQGNSSNRLFKLNSKQLGEEGFSGSAVVSQQLRAAVALQTRATIQEQGAERDTVLAMPLYRIAKLWKLPDTIDVELCLMPEVTNKTIGSQEISWDCTQREFVSHLKQANKVHIVGITNETLADHLKLAFEERNNSAWEELEIIFISKSLMPHYKMTNEKKDKALRRWDSGVATVRAFCFKGDQKAKMISIRTIDSIIPFIGQVYDDSYVRVSFALPFSDLKQSCYLNYQATYPPCHYQKKIISASCSGNDDKTPPCKIEGKPVNCEGCGWGRFSCKSLLKTIMEIKNYSTPLFASNVLGVISYEEGRSQFHLDTLIPQQGWHEYRRKIDNKYSKPVHLCSFILLYHSDKIILQRRTPQNSSGGDIQKLSLLAEKVSDEDFLEAPSDNYRHQVQCLQDGTRTNDELLTEFISELNEEIQSKIEKIQNYKYDFLIGKGKIIHHDILIDACKRTSVKCLMEKLGLDKTTNDLKSNPNSKFIEFDLIEHEKYDLFGTIFGVQLSHNDIQSYRQNAELEPLTCEEFDKKMITSVGDLGHYVQQHREKILNMAKALVKN